MLAARRLLMVKQLARRGICSQRRAPPAVAVVTPLDNPALKALPLQCEAEFLMGADLESMLAYGDRLTQAEALLWIPPGDPAVLRELCKGGHLPNLKWAHGFYAGSALCACNDEAPMPMPARKRVPLAKRPCCC